MGGSWLRRRRGRQLTPFELLLGDPGTVHAADDAFALAERPDSAAWPFVASVGPSSVALRWAGASVPKPVAPWQSRHDPRVWVADRAELAAAGADLEAEDAAVVIGRFQETIVFVNTSRAPGPIAVDGDGEGSALLRELIARQPRSRPDGTGAWWPMEVDGEVILLLGLAIGVTFDADDARRAAELVRLAEARGAERQIRREAQWQAQRQAQLRSGPEDARGQLARSSGEFDDWVRRLEAAAYRTEPRAQAASAPIYAPESTSVPLSAPAPAPDGLDDWPAGFAVSSAEETAHP
jgi:hypothetical protein